MELCRISDIIAPWGTRDLREHMTDVSNLAPAERAKHYRVLAEDALRESERAKEAATKSSYVLIAERFKRLALAAEADTSYGQ